MLFEEGYWLAVHRADPRAYGLYRQHYSSTIKNNHRYRRVGNCNIRCASRSGLVLLEKPPVG